MWEPSCEGNRVQVYAAGLQSQEPGTSEPLTKVVQHIHLKNIFLDIIFFTNLKQDVFPASNYVRHKRKKTFKEKAQ